MKKNLYFLSGFSFSVYLTKVVYEIESIERIESHNSTPWATNIFNKHFPNDRTVFVCFKMLFHMQTITLFVRICIVIVYCKALKSKAFLPVSITSKYFYVFERNEQLQELQNIFFRFLEFLRK